MEVDHVAATDQAVVVGVVDGVAESCDRVEEDAVLEILLGARDDGEFDADLGLHWVEVVAGAAALRVGRARVLRTLGARGKEFAAAGIDCCAGSDIGHRRGYTRAGRRGGCTYRVRVECAGAFGACHARILAVGILGALGH